ncbi:hypothetical protein HMPREF9946_03401 [Acetobacteraceae bacterium AT-5844]|nr:hypothetical protein HMPREF9946_03401 [Acetobacteraceae bacterium AT-5844]
MRGPFVPTHRQSHVGCNSLEMRGRVEEKGGGSRRVRIKGRPDLLDRL